MSSCGSTVGLGRYLRSGPKTIGNVSVCREAVEQNLERVSLSEQSCVRATLCSGFGAFHAETSMLVIQRAELLWQVASVRLYKKGNRGKTTVM